jgi:hypothetical protein
VLTWLTTGGFSENLRPGERRPSIDTDRYGPRTLNTELTFFTGLRAKDALLSFLEIVESIIFPGVAWIVLLNAVFIGVSLASSQTMTTVLLAPPYSWSFRYIGYSVVAIVIATIFVYIVGSWGADKVANWVTKRKGGVREPEVHLWSLTFPLFCGIFGCIVFGVGGTYVYKVHWMAILSGAAFLNFAFLTVNIIGSVYCIESYPKWAGCVSLHPSLSFDVECFMSANTTLKPRRCQRCRIPKYYWLRIHLRRHKLGPSTWLRGVLWHPRRGYRLALPADAIYLDIRKRAQETFGRVDEED